jgi:hypothetical protein
MVEHNEMLNEVLMHLYHIQLNEFYVNPLEMLLVMVEIHLYNEIFHQYQ